MIELGDIVRRDQIIVHFLAYQDIIRRTFQEKHNIDIYDFRNICWMHYICDVHGRFTRKAFNNLHPILNRWKPTRIKNYVDKGWIRKLPRESKTKELYTTTPKLNLLMTNLYKECIGLKVPAGTEANNPYVKRAKKAVEEMLNDKAFFKKANA